jgi:hypothetical protein
MKTKPTLLLALTFLLSVGFPYLSYGFEIISNIKEMVNHGNNIGVMECVQQNTNEKSGLNKFMVKDRCVEKHLKPMEVSYKLTGVYVDPCVNDGIYRYNGCVKDQVSFSGSIENLSKNKIITSVSGYILRENGKDYFEFEDNVQWVLPNNSRMLTVYINKEKVSKKTIDMPRQEWKTETIEIKGLYLSLN